MLSGEELDEFELVTSRYFYRKVFIEKSRSVPSFCNYMKELDSNTSKSIARIKQKYENCAAYGAELEKSYVKCFNFYNQMHGKMCYIESGIFGNILSCIPVVSKKLVSVVPNFSWIYGETEQPSRASEHKDD
jgi:hypothetical protein